MIEHNFLAVSKQYLDIGLKSIDIMIIAQIEEFERNNCQCYITNRQFADILGESESTVKRSIQKLDKLGIIKRHTFVVDGHGKANKQRVLSLNKYEKWKDHIEPTKMERSKVDDGRVKNDKWKAQNDPIKDNKKEKEKDNIRKTKTVLDLISFDKEVQEEIDLGLAEPEDYITDQFYEFALDEYDRLKKDVVFIISYNQISSYKSGKCMGSCLATTGE
jgi:DNA-binding Lrp family transcriptional regulator